jgi:bifunctional enzyme CysN/CysC
MTPGKEALIATDIDAYLKVHEQKQLLRFITCGSVDDGKSTLIGRLLFESHMVFDDHLAALEVDSRQVGTQGGELDFALLVDGLTAEREQGITIDVAYRFFATELKKFIVADTPGHEQYTRNMVTGASTADAAVILIDARKGVLTQTRRHSYLISLLGIEHIVVAVNKLDLMDYSREVFDEIEAAYRAFATDIGLSNITCIPVSALRGVNIVDPAPETPWYEGPTLLTHLERIDVEDRTGRTPFRLPVQWVNRPDPEFRGFCGLIVGGSVRTGDPVRALPSGRTSTVSRLSTFDGDLEEAVAGQSVTLVLGDEIDVSRGDILCSDDQPAEIADQFEAHVIWMDDHEMLPGRPYLIKLGTSLVTATFSQPKYKVNVNTMEHLAARTLELNEVGVCTVSTDRMVPFDPYVSNRDTGGFVIVDRLTNATAGVGLLNFALRRSQNVHWQALEVDGRARSELMGHGSGVVWFTGLSGAGKSTIANRTEQLLHAHGVHTYLLDGDNVRHGLNHDLGFTELDRIENIRRVSEVARLMADAGLVVLASFISPFHADRRRARELIGDGRFCEVHVDTSLEEAERRDRKGLYAKARRGELVNFTGIDSPYEVPEAAEVRIETATSTPDQAAQTLLDQLRAMGMVP